MASLSNTGATHPPRSNPPRRSSSGPPSPCITRSTVTIVMVVSFMVPAPFSLVRSSFGRIGRVDLGLLRPVADARRAIEHGGDVLEQLEPIVERAALDQVEGDVRIPVEDALLPGGACDDGEYDHAEAVHHSGLEQRPAQAEAADSTHWSRVAPLHFLHGFD